MQYVQILMKSSAAWVQNCFFK